MKSFEIMPGVVRLSDATSAEYCGMLYVAGAMAVPLSYDEMLRLYSAVRQLILRHKTERDGSLA
jgi:hypothetical protein